MNNKELKFHGELMLADLSGALIWPDANTVIVSDMHLEKGSYYATKGILLPPYDSIETLQTLIKILAYYCPDRVICLGDSFHDPSAFKRLGFEEKKIIQRLTQTYTWIWITGNHDPNPPTVLGGEVTQCLKLGSLVFRHIAMAGQVHGEVSGHFHPKAKLLVRGKRLAARCFITDGTKRLILPAFGTYTGGLDVTSPAIKRLFNEDFQVWLLGHGKIFSFAQSTITSHIR